MSYIGQGPQFASFPSKFFNGDGSAMTVTLDYAPPNLASLLVFIDGVRQDTSAYTLSGTSLTFTGTVPSGTNNVQVVHLGLQVDVGVPGDDTITSAMIVDGAVVNADLADMAANTVKVRDANSSGVPSDKAVADTQVLIGDGTGFTAAALSSDVTMTNAGAVTIADNAVSLAKMAGLARGKIIYGDASGDPAALTVGTSGQALVSDGTDISWGSAGASNIDGLSDCLVENNSVWIGNDPSSTTSTASFNAAVGTTALDAVTTGDHCTAMGYGALGAMTDGYTNTAVGTGALRDGTSLTGNTGCGKDSGIGITGANNSGLGYNGMDGATAATNCSYLGFSAAGSAADASNEITLGNPSISNLRCNDTTISSLSDQRDKTQIENLPDAAGLDFINSLQPRTFYWDRREWYENGVPDGSKVKTNHKRWKENSGQRMGFIAQEVQSAISGLKYMEDSGVINGSAEKLEFAPAHLITPLIKAVQQLSAEVESLKAQLEGQ